MSAFHCARRLSSSFDRRDVLEDDDGARRFALGAGEGRRVHEERHPRFVDAASLDLDAGDALSVERARRRLRVGRDWASVAVDEPGPARTRLFDWRAPIAPAEHLEHRAVALDDAPTAAEHRHADWALLDDRTELGHRPRGLHLEPLQSIDEHAEERGHRHVEDQIQLVVPARDEERMIRRQEEVRDGRRRQADAQDCRRQTGAPRDDERDGIEEERRRGSEQTPEPLLDEHGDRDGGDGGAVTNGERRSETGLVRVGMARGGFRGAVRRGSRGATSGALEPHGGRRMRGGCLGSPEHWLRVPWREASAGREEERSATERSVGDSSTGAARERSPSRAAKHSRCHGACSRQLRGFPRVAARSARRSRRRS